MSPDLEQPLVPAPIYRAPEPPSTNILVGPLGIRAGWGILLFFVLSGLLGTVLFITAYKATGHYKEFQRESQQARLAAREAKLAHRRYQPPPARPSFAMPAELAEASAVLLAGLALSYVERRRFRVYGLGARHLRDALSGAGWGFLAMCLLITLLRVFHLLVFDRRLLSLSAAVRYGGVWLFFFLLVGIFEEFLFRGYIQFALMRGLLGLGRRLAPTQPRTAAFWLAAVLWSLIFLAAHIGNAGENPAGLVAVFLAGMVFSYALWRTGSLWWGVGAHMTWDWAQSFLFGVPDSGNLSAGRLFATHALGRPLLSGGVDGPEGSLLVIPVLLLLLAAIHLQPQASQPPIEPESVPGLSRANAPQPIA